MFAGAAREVVFANPEVVRRVNEKFVPVALKAALVNNPPRGPEGELYAEIGRSKPAPQGICTVNSDGKVLAWALSFDDDASILKFLDHVASRYAETSEGSDSVVAERFMKFPSRKLDDVEDNEKRLAIPEQHSARDRCPAAPAVEKGTLVGRIVGRPLDSDGDPIADTIRQEDYLESRVVISIARQEQLAAAVGRSDDKRFRIPGEFARELVSHAYLGQLDVDPMGIVPGSHNERGTWSFAGEIVDSGDPEIVRVRVEGRSDVEGGQDDERNLRSDGRLWQHRVTLRWQGYIDIHGDHIVRLAMIAEGNERLRWGNARWNLLGESDVEHLMAGHAIDLDCTVRYGLLAEPCTEDESVDGDSRN